MKSRHADLLEPLGILSGCSKRELAQLEPYVTMVRVAVGETLCRQGEPGRETFIIVEGSVSVTRDGTEIAVLGAGDLVGEIAVLEGSPRTATVTTLTPATLLVLTPAELGALLEVDPVARSVADTLRARLAAASAPAVTKA